MHVDAVAAGNAYEEGNQAVMEGHSRWGCWWPHDGVATPNQDGGNLLVMPTTHSEADSQTVPKKDLTCLE